MRFKSFCWIPQEQHIFWDKKSYVPKKLSSACGLNFVEIGLTNFSCLSNINPNFRTFQFINFICILLVKRKLCVKWSGRNLVRLLTFTRRRSTRKEINIFFIITTTYICLHINCHPRLCSRSYVKPIFFYLNLAFYSRFFC